MNIDHLVERSLPRLPSIRRAQASLARYYLAGDISAKEKHSKQPPLDQIQVVAHLPVPGGEIVQFLTTQHYRRDYLYAEHASGKKVSLIDITNVRRPTILAEISDSTGVSDALVALQVTPLLFEL